MRKSKPGTKYPDDWPEIARAIKDQADWRCERCHRKHSGGGGRILTVHHLDMNPNNNAWWNLAALCQRCHLRIQNKVEMSQTWMFDHSEWMRPHVAGYTAHRLSLPENKPWVMANQYQLLKAAREGTLT